MKRLIALVMLLLLLPALACAQGLDAGLEQALGQVDLARLKRPRARTTCGYIYCG